MEQILKAPAFKPKIHFWKFQFIGILLLMSIPVLAAFGFFGRSEKSFEIHKSQGLSLWGTYSSRTRVGQIDHIVIHLKNNGELPQSNLEVHIDPNYVHQFSSPVFYPALESPYVIPLKEISPRREAVVRIELKADKMGKHRGHFEIKNSEEGSVMDRVQLESWVFP